MTEKKYGKLFFNNPVTLSIDVFVIGLVVLRQFFHYGVVVADFPLTQTGGAQLHGMIDP